MASYFFLKKSYKNWAFKKFFSGKFQIFTGPPLVKTKIGFEKIFPEKFSDF